MKVTFDTNVLDHVCRPERFPKDPRQRQMWKVNAALKSGTVKGFYSVAMLTIEGIKRGDRAGVFAGTRIIRESGTTAPGDGPPLEDFEDEIDKADVEAVSLTLRVEQPDRTPLPSAFSKRVRTATMLGFKTLKSTPRLGGFQLDDPEGRYYLDTGQGNALGAWQRRIFEVSRAIETRGVGIAQLKTIGLSLAAGPEEPWFSALNKVQNVHQQNAIVRAFAEWADAEAVASHVAYGLDVFCSEDVGKSSAAASVLDEDNRSWLASTYGVKFMSLCDLSATLE